jgi:hypothetical protein
MDTFREPKWPRSLNKLPKEPGLLLFPISMSRIYSSQNGKKTLERLLHFEKKVSRTNVGLAIVYTDGLYQKYNQEAEDKLHKYFEMMQVHKNAYLKELRKTTLIEKGTSFTVWNQACLHAERFTDYYHKLLALYQSDTQLQKHVHEDIRNSKKIIERKNELFVLEELLLCYLILKGKTTISNDFLLSSQQWILLCYPGPASQVFTYFFQNNFFNLDNPLNTYQHHYYDLDSKTLYDYRMITL